MSEIKEENNSVGNNSNIDTDVMEDEEDLIKVLTDPENLSESLNRMMKASGWKTATQNLYLTRLVVFGQIEELFTSGKPYKMKRGNNFVLNERGKCRYVHSLDPFDMLIQLTLTNYILIPKLSKFLIHDNGASMKGKGISFTRRRFEQHLHSFYRNHGLRGYVMKIDFRKYFDNIQHEIVVDRLRKYIHDERIIHIIEQILDHYKIDVSYSDEDPSELIKKVYNSIEYNQISKSLLTGEKYMRKSVGIGSPVSQILGIFFPLLLDNYVKTVCGVKYYDVYMDDRIVIHESKEYLKQLFKQIRLVCNELGIIINENKSYIFPIHNEFSFLQTKYKLTATGKVLKRISSKTVTRERRKLKKLAAIVVNENLDINLFENQYKSWRGGKEEFYKMNRQLANLDTLYTNLHRSMKLAIRQKIIDKELNENGVLEVKINDIFEFRK